MNSLFIFFFGEIIRNKLASVFLSPFLRHLHSGVVSIFQFLKMLFLFVPNFSKMKLKQSVSFTNG